jgi:hypothetical protein
MQNSAGARQKCLAEFGETHGTAEAVKEAGAKLVFKFQDLLRQRRLRDVRLFGGTRERARVSNSAEVTKLVKFHRLCLSILSEVDIGTIGRGVSTIPTSLGKGSVSYPSRKLKGKAGG